MDLPRINQGLLVVAIGLGALCAVRLEAYGARSAPGPCRT